MITALDDLPDGVIGFRVTGELHAADYTDVVEPAVGAAARQGDIRIVIVVEELDKMSSGALREDMHMGTHHLTAWKKTAFVSDIDWMNHLVSLFGWMSPGEMRRFHLAELDDAIAWAAS